MDGGIPKSNNVMGMAGSGNTLGGAATAIKKTTAAADSKKKWMRRI